MRHFRFYDPSTGLFVDRAYSTNMEPESELARMVEANTPDGLAPIEGTFDHLSQRVDTDAVAKAYDQVLATHQSQTLERAKFSPSIPGQILREPPAPVMAATADHVVDWQPPQPTADHEWDLVTRRWQLSAGARSAAAKRMEARSQIAALESAQHRALREHALGNPDGTKRLQEIEQKISEFRTALAAT